MRRYIPHVALALFFLSCYLSGGGGGGGSSVELKAEVRNSPDGIMLRNGGQHPYKDITIKINYGLSGEYVAALDSLAPGASRTIPYSQFTDSSHTRFNYFTTKVDRVMVRASVNGRQTWEEFK